MHHDCIRFAGTTCLEYVEWSPFLHHCAMLMCSFSILATEYLYGAEIKPPFKNRYQPTSSALHVQFTHRRFVRVR